MPCKTTLNTALEVVAVRSVSVGTLVLQTIGINMSMNRETKRMLQKQGQMDDEGNPIGTKRAPQVRAKSDRVSPAQFTREVRGELRKVAWPTRNEVINYAIIVLATIVILTSIIGVFDFGFGKAVIALFDR